jgi:hypothetical protein
MPEDGGHRSSHTHDRSERRNDAQKRKGRRSGSNSVDRDTDTGEGIFDKLVQSNEEAARHVTNAVTQLLHTVCYDLLGEVSTGMAKPLAWQSISITKMMLERSRHIFLMMIFFLMTFNHASTDGSGGVPRLPCTKERSR